MSEEEKVVAIDFDGTIVEFEGWDGPYSVGDVLWEENPRENLKALRENGYKVMIYTCRSVLEPVREKLNSAGIPFDYINENPHQPDGISPAKLYADWYVDDRNPNFKGLDHAVRTILKEDGKNRWPSHQTDDEKATA